MEVYQTIAPKTISSPEMDSLMLIYQPIIGALAVQLYIILSAQSRHYPYPSTFNHLATLTFSTMQEIKEAKEKCESVHLISTYKKENEYQSLLFFELHPVLDIQDALTHDVLGRMLVKVFSPMTLELIKSQFTKPIIDKSELTKVELNGNRLLLEWEVQQEKVYQKNKQLPKVTHPSVVEVFNMTLFNQTCSELLFPLSARTKENLEAINHFGNIYGIDETTMEKIVGKAVSLKDNSLDINKLQRLCESTQSKVNALPDDKYQANSLDFLASLQDGKPVGANDKKVIAFLSEYGFDQAVQNILIEYVIHQYGGTFTKNNVEKIADSWLRAKIVDKKSALKQVGKGYSKKTETSLPDHMQQAKTTPTLTTAQREQIIAHLKKGKAHEEN